MKTRSLRLWLLSLLLLAGLPLRAFAALSAATVWECRASGASDNNGGAFVAGAAGTDFSQQNAAQVVINNTTITTSITANVITFTGYTPTSADVGNLVHMLTGTNVTAGWYQITAQTATTWTVTGAVSLPTSGTTTNATGNMGGALATLGTLSGAMVASNKAYATGAFTTTTATAIVFAQTVTTTSAAAPPTRLIGYGVTRGDTTHATVTLQTNTGQTGLKATGLSFYFEQMDVDCGSLGTSTGIAVGTSGLSLRCKVANFTTAGITVGSSAHCTECEATAGGSAATAITSAGVSTVTVTRCFVHDNACGGILIQSGFAAFNLIANNSGATSDGIVFANLTTLLNNTCHNNGRDGIRASGTTQLAATIRNNLLTNNGGFGLTMDTSAALPASYQYDGNAYFSNTSGARSNADSVTGIYGVAPYTNTMDVTLTASPYIGPTTGASANFALNDVTGGGRSCRRAGTPATWPGNTGTTGYPDMGAVQTRSVIRRPFFGF